MKNINVQLYSLGHDNTDPLPVSFEKLAAMGYTGVEFAGSNYGGMTAAQLRAELDKNGLVATSSHVSMDKMAEDMALVAGAGCKAIICPMFAYANAEEAKVFGEMLNKVGEEAKKNGMVAGYHNHTVEFFVDGGKTLLQHLMDNTDPDLVALELDCGWASCAGADPVATINNFAGRIVAIHVKENNGVMGPDTPVSMHAENKLPFEIGPDGKPIFTPEFLAAMAERQKLNVPTGQGIVDWKAVRTAADAQAKRGDIIYVVEREASYGDKTRLECLAEDARWIHENM